MEESGGLGEEEIPQDTDTDNCCSVQLCLVRYLHLQRHALIFASLEYRNLRGRAKKVYMRSSQVKVGGDWRCLGGYSSLD